jgi:hypothetical protein
VVITGFLALFRTELLRDAELSPGILEKEDDRTGLRFSLLMEPGELIFFMSSCRVEGLLMAAFAGRERLCFRDTNLSWSGTSIDEASNNVGWSRKYRWSEELRELIVTTVPPVECLRREIALEK